MRNWSIAVVTAVALTVGACGPKPVALPTSGTPHYPDFVEPRVPLAMNSTPASGAQARAWQFLQAGDLRNAEREAAAALKLAPEFFPASTTLAYLDLAKRDPRGAVVKFDRVLAREADYVPALVGRGQAFTTLNRDEDAVQSFEAALRGDPSLSDVSRRLDVVRLRLAQRSITAALQAAKNEKFPESIEAYRAAIARTPDSAFLYRELALIERDHGDGDAAIEHFRKATALEPADAASFADLAAMLDARNEFDAALKAYDSALALEPDPDLQARRTALRLRADVARLPAEYRNIETAPQVTRGELAALIGFRLQALLAGGRMRDVGVVTDIRGHWAERWILDVARAGIMEPFEWVLSNIKE